MKDKILILGNGFIGQKLKEAFGAQACDARITSIESAQAQIDKYSPAIVINCIGHTGIKNVDDCELDKEKTLFSNTFVPVILAEAAFRNNIKLVHISSGCIYHYDYSKNVPIAETDEPDFFDLYYSRCKIYAEKALSPLFKDSDILIARIRIPLDNRPHPKNILTKLIGYKKVIDLPNSVTYVPDFIEALKHLINIDAKGIYNVVNAGGLRYPNLMDIYRKYKPDFNYERIEYSKLNTGKRTNLIMSTEKLRNSGFKVRSIEEVLEECVKEYVKY